MRMNRMVVAAVVCGLASAASLDAQRAGGGGTGRPRLTLTSPVFEDGGDIPARFTQAVEKFVSPKLEWANVPDGAVSFVLLFHDPDVALQRKVEDSLHWLLFNIPGSAREVPEAVPAIPRLPDGTVQAQNRRGLVGYLGPGAPPPGPRHHYTFELYALDTKLDLGPDATRAQVLSTIDGHIVGKAVLVGRFVMPPR